MFVDDTKLCHRARNTVDINELQENTISLLNGFNVDNAEYCTSGTTTLQL